MNDKNYFEKASDFVNNTEDETNQFSAEDINENKGISILSYLWILFLIPLLAKPNSKFARFHANQGLVFFIFSIIANAAVKILEMVLRLASFGAVNLLISIIIGMVSFAVWIILITFMILGIVNVANGKAKKLPLIGGISLIK